MNKRLLPYFLFSLLLHLLLGLGASLRSFLAPEAKQQATIWVDLQQGKYEVVDILPPKEERRPETAHFLGLHDSQVDQEKVAMHRAPSMEEKAGSGRGTSDAEGPGWSMEPVGEGESAALAEDYYPDFRRGRHTYLNVLRFPDIQYFVRLKRAFKMTFNPIPSLREAYVQNRIVEGKIETVLGVSIDAQGNLDEIFVVKGSGISEFDAETLRTIRVSSPFSAPPTKLLDGDGLVRMSWTFTVYL